jgi:hypothetical protein
VTDIIIENHGSVVLVRPITNTGHKWIDEHVDSEGWQWFGDALAVEPRYVGGLVEGAVNDGLVCGE